MSARDFITTHRPALWLAGAACLLIAASVGLTVRLARSHSDSVHGLPLSPPSPAPSAHALPDFEVKPVSDSEGLAKWYDVPDNSLPRRRAWPGELTAASDRLPPDSYVRVRCIDDKADPDKTIVVRITDNGVHDKNTVIDLNREAAEALGMVRTGQARVHVEVLALKNVSTDKPIEKKDEPPTAPKASELTDQPTTSEKQEKDAAAAKPQG